jgi:hypothetical protein
MIERLARQLASVSNVALPFVAAEPAQIVRPMESRF